jgi:ABC-type lipoprotein release transport system permease subunit
VSNLVVGLGLMLIAVRALQSQLYGVRAYDGVTLTAVPIVLAVIALAASFVPTLRIAQINPAETLRME